MNWETLPRGTRRAILNPLELDVFKVGFEGWRYNILNVETGNYIASQLGFETESECKLAAETRAKNQLCWLQHGIA